MTGTINTWCTADAFEEARDVCYECGEAFCEQHLIYHRAEKSAPLCKRCARRLAGLHGTRSKSRLGRREYARRRRELALLLQAKREEPTAAETPPSDQRSRRSTDQDQWRNWSLPGPVETSEIGTPT